MLSGLWRNGRVVEGGSLENCCAARYRGFKSYFLRQVCHRPGNLPGLFSFKRKTTEHGTRNHTRRISPLQRKRIRGHWRGKAFGNRRAPSHLPRALWRARPLGATARHGSQAKSTAISTPTPSNDTDSNGRNRPPFSNIVSRGPAPPKTTKGSSRKARAFSKKGPIP